MTFEETYQKYLNESDPDRHPSMELLFRWFYDEGRQSGIEQSAKIVEDFDTCMCCSEYEIAEAIRAGGAK